MVEVIVILLWSELERGCLQAHDGALFEHLRTMDVLYSDIAERLFASYFLSLRLDGVVHILDATVLLDAEFPLFVALAIVLSLRQGLMRCSSRDHVTRFVKNVGLLRLLVSESHCMSAQQLSNRDSLTLAAWLRKAHELRRAELTRTASHGSPALPQFHLRAEGAEKKKLEAFALV